MAKITPFPLYAHEAEMMSDPDRVAAARAVSAMLKMVKFDIAALQAAHAGTAT